jgi:hypothetical protein
MPGAHLDSEFWRGLFARIHCRSDRLALWVPGERLPINPLNRSALRNGKQRLALTST